MLREAQEMDESSDPSPPSSPQDIVIDRIKEVWEWTQDQMDQSSDLAQKNDDQLLKKHLLNKFKEALEELFPEAWISVGEYPDIRFEVDILDNDKPIKKKIINIYVYQEDRVYMPLCYPSFWFNDPPRDPFNYARGRHIKEWGIFAYERLRKVEQGNQAKMENCHYHSPYSVIDIVGQNGAVKEDQKMTNKCNTFPEFFSSRIIHGTPKHDCGTLWGTLYAGQLGQLWALGNPFDNISQFTSIDKGTEKLLSFGQACSTFLPAIIWSGMFFLNFIYTAILSRTLPFHVPANLMLVFSLVYYILALAGTMSGFNVLWGPLKMSGLLFVSGGAMGLMLLIAFVIMGVLYTTWRFSLN